MYPNIHHALLFSIDMKQILYDLILINQHFNVLLLARPNPSLENEVILTFCFYEAVIKGIFT